MYKIGQVIHIDQGHPDDNYYAVVADEDFELGIMVISAGENTIVNADMTRALTDEEKGE